MIVSRRILLAGSLVVVAGAALAVALGRTADCQTAGCESDADGARDPITLEVDPPPRLSATGLYADIATRTIAPGVRAFSPQYPLWTDGAEKRRFILVPAPKTIDARYPSDWRFPVGTKLWKEFAFGTGPTAAVETRYMERLADGRWILAAYAWDADGRDATVVPRGARSVREIPGASGARHDIPSRLDCMACHDGRTTPVLGFTALQLSPDRDPLAPHADAPPPGSLDLASLAAAGLLRGAPSAWKTSPPRIAAPSPRARAALGYLHANCATCHRAEGDLRRLALSFEPPLDDEEAAPATSTTVGVPSRFHPPASEDAPVRIAPGDPARSVVVRRMNSRVPAVQMPPLGTRVVDREGVELVTRFIRDDLAPSGAAAERPSR